MSDEAEVAFAVWLPIGRANFYSYTANNWLTTGEDPNVAHSFLLNSHRYPPMLQVSVLRRILEVLPTSFGYDLHGKLARGAGRAGNGDADDMSRPTAVTMTMRPTATNLVDPHSSLYKATKPLLDAGLTEVSVTVDENGFYTFAAPWGPDKDTSRAALEQHMCEVFGGSFSLEWQRDSLQAEAERKRRIEEERRPLSEDEIDQSAPARIYNGLYNVRTRQPVTAGPYTPLGIFTFFQLNTLFEGIFNDALTPAIFFEQHDFMEEYREGTRYQELFAEAAAATSTDNPLTKPAKKALGRTTTVLHDVADVIRLLNSELDARTPHGKMLTLRHFLAVTSRESLQKLKWSVESVRRGLLDEMMGILHRQSRLNQLKLDKLGAIERSPELAVGANESQLRGYAMLAGAKLPLVTNVHRFAVAAAAELDGDRGEFPGDASPNGQPGSTREAIDAARQDLTYRLSEWHGLLQALAENIQGLQKAVEHAWMERVLYEQEQTRAEQEAMAEIERSRSNRPVSGVAGQILGGSYNGLMLYFTVAAGIFAALTLPETHEGNTWQRISSLWPFALIAIVVSLVAGVADRIRRRKRERKDSSDGYGYEFAFRLDRMVEPRKVRDHLTHDWVDKVPGKGEHDDIAGMDKQAANDCGSLPKIRVERRGGVRVEYVSEDATLVKLHFVARFDAKSSPADRGAPARHTARFEVINEILARKVSDRPQYVLRESRIFGDSSRALKPDEVLHLVRFVLDRCALPFLTDGSQLTADDILLYATDLFVPPQEHAGRQSGRQATNRKNRDETAAIPALAGVASDM